jgi:hypothetical protein
MKFYGRAEVPGFCKQFGLPVAETSLSTFATRGGGPPYFIWNGKAVYEEGALRAWVQSRMQQPTSRTARGAPRTSQQMVEDAAIAKVFDQRVLAVGLHDIALRAGGTFEGSSRDIQGMQLPGPGWPASAAEMQMRGLPELAQKPGFAGVTVTRLGRGDLWRLVASTGGEG